MSPEERVLARLREWAPRFMAGELKDRALLSPTLRPGERFGTKLNSIGVSRVPSDDPLAAVDPAGPIAGLAYGTSERLLIANGGKVKQAWEWSQLSEVVLLHGYAGVVLRTDSAVADAVHRVRLRHDFFAPKPWVTAARWLSLEGCFAASQGRLDTWLERLPARVLT